MDKNFDLDSINNLLNSEKLTDLDSSFVIEDILKEFGSQSQSTEDLPVQTVQHEPEKKETAKTQIMPDSTIATATKETEKTKTFKEFGTINEEISKPDGYSLTGAFEAIRSAKQADTVSAEDITESAESFDDTLLQSSDEKEESNEIVAPIEHKRFFNTETFNSIKEGSSANVKESIVSFASGDEEEEDDGEEEFFKPSEPTEEIDDYDRTEDRDDIINELKKINSNASMRVLFTFVLTVISGLFFAVGNGWFALPGINMATEFKVFTSIYFGVSVVATFVNISSIINGVKSLLKLKFSTETYLLLIFLLNSILNIVYLVKPYSDNVVVISFDFIYTLFLLFNIFSKRLTAKTIYKNFLISSADGKKCVVNKPSSEEAVNDIMLETGCNSDIVYASKTEFVSDFITKSFKDFEPSETRLNTILAFVVIILGIGNFIFKGNMLTALVYITAALCVTLPVLFGFSFAAPLFFNSKKTRRSGGVIVGSDSAYQLKDVQTFIVDDADVFNTSLNGIRLYGDSLIDDAILYLNALYNTVGGPLRKLFSDMLSDNITSLPRIDDIYYHDTMGYSGLIHSKVFVAGNKKLMDHFGVEVDDSEYEIIYQQKSKHVLFVAYDGKLMGVFLLSYSLSHGVTKAFEICEKNQIAVCIAERDANVNERTLFDAYKPKEKVLFNIISFRTARNCFEKFELKHKTPSLLISHTGIKGLAAALRSCKTIEFAFKTNKIITTIASVIAVPLITFLLFFSEPSANLAIQVLVYQALWSLPILFVSLFSK